MKNIEITNLVTFKLPYDNVVYTGIVKEINGIGSILVTDMTNPEESKTITIHTSNIIKVEGKHWIPNLITHPHVEFERDLLKHWESENVIEDSSDKLADYLQASFNEIGNLRRFMASKALETIYSSLEILEKFENITIVKDITVMTLTLYIKLFRTLIPYAKKRIALYELCLKMISIDSDNDDIKFYIDRLEEIKEMQKTEELLGVLKKEE